MNAEQNHSKINMPEGQDLLQGLYLVQSYLERSNEKLTEYLQLEKQYRSSIAHIGRMQHIRASEQKSLYGLFVAGIAFSVISAVAALFSGNMSTVLFGIICVVIFAIGRTKENKTLLTIGIVCIALMLFTWVTGMVRSVAYFHSIGNDTTIIFSAGIQIIGLVVAVIVSGLLLKKYNAGVSRKNSIIDAQNQEIARKNQEIVQHNLVIDNQRKQCMVELTAINREMVDKTESWFPPDYYALNANEQFIDIVRNHRADTVKEMINTYLQDGYQNQVLNNQEAMKQKMDQSLENQQQIIKLQRIANVLLAANLVANMATAANTSSIAASNQEIARNTAATARNTAATAANTAASAESSKRIAASVASAARDADAMARKIHAKW